jgi:NhaP-type Na+/H+ or K+/H+ antiporter
VVVVAATIFAWGLISARLERADLTAPIVFVAVGAILAALGLIDISAAPENFKPLVEVTLVWVLFSDAARVRVPDIRNDLGCYVRLLGVGLPLTVAFGWVLAFWLVPGLDMWLALLVGAALAPTDAALGVPVVTNRLVPSRVRRLITVESGLNDGIATPLVVLAIAGAASVEGHAEAPGLGEALVELALGVVVGVAVGFVGGGLLRWARRRVLPSSRSPSAPMRAQSLWVGMASSPRFAGGWHSAPRLVGGAPRRSCSSSRRAAWFPCSCGSCSV